MYYRSVSVFGVMLLFVFVIGCSSGGDVISPVTDEGNLIIATTEAGQGEARIAKVEVNPPVCLGFWQCVVDMENESVESIQLRTSNMMLNALGFMEPPAGENISFEIIDVVFPKTVRMLILLTHPYPEAYAHGFDVRGVIFGAELRDADGFTLMPSPEFFEGETHGYVDGLLGIPYNGNPDYHGLAGYKYYADAILESEDVWDYYLDEDHFDNRGCFIAGTSIAREFLLGWDEPGDFYVFNYAVYANWDLGVEPWNPEDYPVSANSQEAVAYNVNHEENTLWYYDEDQNGGKLSFAATFKDWQDNIHYAMISADGVIDPFNGEQIFVDPVKHNMTYMFEDVPVNLNASGTLEVLFTVEDWVTYGGNWFQDALDPLNPMYGKVLAAYFPYRFNVEQSIMPIPTGIDPDCGYSSGFPVEGYTVSGENFIDWPGLEVWLAFEDDPVIKADNVEWSNANEIECDLQITIGTPPGDYQVMVVNPAGYEATSGEIFAIENPAVIWNPTISLAIPAAGHMARPVWEAVPDEMTIRYNESIYRPHHWFWVEGPPATGCDPSYEYIVSDDHDVAENMTHNWVPWLESEEYLNGIIMVVPWEPWEAFAPRDVWVWIRAVDDGVASSPVVGIEADVIHLARVISEFGFKAGEDEWIIGGDNSHTDVIYHNAGDEDYIEIHGKPHAGDNDDFILHTGALTLFTDNVRFVMYAEDDWLPIGGGDADDIFEGVHQNMWFNDQQTITGQIPGDWWVEEGVYPAVPITDYENKWRRIGLYIHKEIDPPFSSFHWYIGAIGIYDDP